jgi:hypothetical protein
MRSPTAKSTDRRKSAATASSSGSGVKGARSADKEVVTQAGGADGAVVTSMVDALEDILKWERASERAMRVAAENSTTELDPSN